MLIPDLTRVPAQLRDYLGRLGTIAVDHLGDDLLGIYLIGSAAQGVYEHELSDVDVMIVSASRHPEHARRALAEQIVYPTLPCPTVGLECVWYAAPDLDPLGDPVMFQLNVNGGPERARTIELEPGDEPQWWAVLDLAAARAVGVSLIGPSVDEVVPPVPWPRLRQAIEESQAFHDGADAGSPNRVLNLARLVLLVEDGLWLSKPEGAARLRASAPEFAPALDEALRARAVKRWLDPAPAEPLSRRLRAALAARP